MLAPPSPRLPVSAGRPVTPLDRALTIPLTFCHGECAGGVLPCGIHAQIAQAIQEAVEAATREASRWTA